MNGPHIVRRAFKAGGVFYPQGTVVEDVTVIKNFKIRLSESVLIPIPEDEEALNLLAYIMEVRAGVDLHAVLADRASKGSEIAEPGASADQPTPGTSPDLASGGFVTTDKLVAVGDGDPVTVVPLTGATSDTVKATVSQVMAKAAPVAPKAPTVTPKAPPTVTSKSAPKV